MFVFGLFLLFDFLQRPKQVVCVLPLVVVGDELGVQLLVALKGDPALLLVILLRRYIERRFLSNKGHSFYRKLTLTSL